MEKYTLFIKPILIKKSKQIKYLYYVTSNSLIKSFATFDFLARSFAIFGL